MIIKFITIQTGRLEESINFYQDVLGFKEVRRIDQVENLIMVFLQDKEGGIIELTYNSLGPNRKEVVNENSVTFGISVDSMEDTVSLLKTHNLSLDKGPIATPGGEVIGFMKDPNGVEIEFIEGFKHFE